MTCTKIRSKPDWLKKKLPVDSEYEKLRIMLKKNSLTTVCLEAKCPNQWECFSKHTATFLIMGPKCTRNCGFCAVQYAPELLLPDKDEPARVAKAAASMKLDYMVVTSVTRDDLKDGGACFFAQTICEIRKVSPKAKVEVLIPDFMGNKQSLITVLKAGPDVLNHNIETVKQLYASVRPGAFYSRSLELFKRAKEFSNNIKIKSGIMLGLGETDSQIEQTLADIYNAGTSILTIGQYLQPTKANLKVKKFYTPQEFEFWKQKGLEIGFSQVASGPFVRSSFNAKQLYGLD